MHNETEAMIKEVIRAEQALAQAHLTLDIDTFERLLHPGFVNVGSGGKIDGKQETIDSIRPKDNRSRRYWDIAQIDELVVQIYGASAVVTGRWRGKGQNGDEAFDYVARILSVWVKEDGAWRNVAAQSTEIESK